jgi:spermidine/putrescine transport system permease protein
MVFVPALGEFVIPDILGGAQGFYLGGLISEQFLKARNWPFGAALSLFLLISALILVFLQRNGNEEKMEGERK